MKNTKDYKVLSGFILKILALIFMTLDHIGYYLGTLKNTQEIASIFRIFGRLALPLFIFLLVEGVIHTKHIGKYFIRLGALALVFLIGQLFLAYIIRTPSNDFYSPAVDLLLTALLVYLLKRKDKFSFLAILPFAWACISLVVRNYETINGKFINWFPIYFRPDYGIYAPLLGIGFYFAHDLTKLFLNSNEGTKNFLGSTFEQTTYNVVSSIFLIIVTMLICFLDRNAMHLIYSMPWQVYALFAFIPILFYSGKRGYNAKWFQYGCYVYFPMHLVIIFLVFELLL